ncbi:MAG: peptidylprolyl isomerase [Candidatus Acidiferrales bacterium]|jgi:peptidyl-prolyl cis-trans isomerase SurA
MKIWKVFPMRFSAGIIASAALTLILPSPAPAQSKGIVVEEIVARVNNDAITLSDVQKADQALHEEIAHDCQGCPPEKVEELYKDKQKDLLRDLIDQALLVERAKDMGISVETDVIKRLDEIRKQNNLGSMEELEKAVESQGLGWEDFKSQIRNTLLTQEVIRREVGSHINIPSDAVKKYYDDHQKDFNRPEQVVLSEIFLSTQGKSPEEMSSVEKKAEDLRNRVVKGEDFNEIAKHFSEGSTAKDGGELGTFNLGMLAKQLEDVVFKLDKGQMSEVIQTKEGFEILKVDAHYQAGLQPLDKVENEIMNRIYSQKMQPTMREYLGQLREQSYVMVKPGYTDSAAVAGASVIQEVAPTPDAADAKKAKKKMAKPKVNGQ